MSAPKTPEHIRWLKANGHSASLAMLTGTDHRALAAIAACWELYAYADDSPHVLAAIRSLLQTMQPKCWRLARESIAYALDWSDRDRLWPLVVPEEDDGRTEIEVLSP